MKNKILVVFCIVFFVLSSISFTTAENISKNKEKISLELTKIDEPITDTGLLDYPLVVITNPQDGDNINIPYLEIIGYAEDPEGLNYMHWKWECAYFSYTNDSILDISSKYKFRIRLYDIPEGGHKVTVTFCNINDNCSFDDVTVTYTENNPPEKPGRPYGPDRGVINTEYTFSTHSTDPENDTIRYGWDWDGDNVVDEWTNYYPSGETVFASHSWSYTGTYPIKVKAEDSNGLQSALSSPLSILITDNNPPNQPETPTGPGKGRPGKSYTFSTLTTDPDGDRIYYMFDWDDGTELEWFGPFNSGDTTSFSHIWDNEGSFQVKVKAIDDPNGDGNLTDGLESVWSESAPISMPKNKELRPLGLLFEKFSFIREIILNYISNMY